MNNELKPIYTEPENCQDCYKCIRECPVKAIRIENNKAYIIQERCIYCGHCTQVCPNGAKKIRDGIPRTKMILKSYDKVIVSLAPSYVNEFNGATPSQLIAAIRRLGFTAVSETALGAELVSTKVNDFLKSSHAGVYISSACPVIVEYIRKYSKEHIPAITPIVSPMLAHAKMLKQLYGEEVKVIFIGPCICKKLEADNFKELVEVAITFRDLKEWFTKENIDPATESSTEEDNCFIPYEANLGALYPVEGGMLAGLKDENKNIVKMAFSDMENVKEVIKNLNVQRENDTLFLELLSCQGGCVNGPARLTKDSLATKRYNIVNHRKEGDANKDFCTLDLSTHYQADEQIKTVQYSEIEIKQALEAIGKTCPADELNCSGCGYDSCRDFALAMLDGRAEGNMCVGYMRKVAHDKATVLLQKIPAGVLLVDENLKVVDMNRYAATLLGEEALTVYDVAPGLHGVELNKICKFESVFNMVLTSGKEITENQLRENDNIWLLSVYNIQPHHLVFGLLQDLHEPYIRKEWMLEKTREVIRRHMETVQQVACILGENAAYEDATLRSVMETMNDKR